MMDLKERIGAMAGDEAKRLLAVVAETIPDAGRLLAAMLDPRPAAFMTSVDALMQSLGKRRGPSEWEYEQELEALQREARLLPVASQPEAGLALVKLGTAGYEFSNRLDDENAAAIDEGLMLFAEASLALGQRDAALAKLRELEKADNYGLNAQEAIAQLAKVTRKR